MCWHPGEGREHHANIFTHYTAHNTRPTLLYCYIYLLLGCYLYICEEPSCLPDCLPDWLPKGGGTRYRKQRTVRKLELVRNTNLVRN